MDIHDRVENELRNFQKSSKRDWMLNKRIEEMGLKYETERISSDLNDTIYFFKIKKDKKTIASGEMQCNTHGHYIKNMNINRRKK